MLHAVRLQVWNKELASGDVFLGLGFPSSCFGKHGIISYPEGFFFCAVWFPFNKHKLEDTHGLTDFSHTAHLHDNPLSSRLSPTPPPPTLYSEGNRPLERLGDLLKVTSKSRHILSRASLAPTMPLTLLLVERQLKISNVAHVQRRPTALAARSPPFSFLLSC